MPVPSVHTADGPKHLEVTAGLRRFYSAEATPKGRPGLGPSHLLLRPAALRGFSWGGGEAIISWECGDRARCCHSSQDGDWPAEEGRGSQRDLEGTTRHKHGQGAGPARRVQRPSGDGTDRVQLSWGSAWPRCLRTSSWTPPTQEVERRTRQPQGSGDTPTVTQLGS